jgi:hypothetical protein
MITGVYKAALELRLFLKLGTTASSAPVSTTGMTEILSLSDASLQTTSETQTATDYQTPFGYGNLLVTGKSWTMPLQLNLDVTSEGYKLLRRADTGAPGGTTVQLWRELPLFGSSNTDPQVETGVAFVGGYQETMARGNIMTISFTLNGYGPPLTYQQGDGIATLTLTNPGAGLSAGTGIALVPVTPAAGNLSGLGGTATITVNGSGIIQTATIVDAGRNFKVGDTLTMNDPAVFGTGDTAPLFTVATVA